jgi:hypothetical protein
MMRTTLVSIALMASTTEACGWLSKCPTKNEQKNTE